MLLLSVTFFIGVYSQKPDFERMVYMIDSANSARIDEYAKKCFPDYAVLIRFKGDTFSLCSIETVLMVAPDIEEDQLPVLEQFMVNMANYYALKRIPVTFEYGMIPGSVEMIYDKMFNRREIFVSSAEINVTHSRAIDLLLIFNKITTSSSRSRILEK